MNARWPLNVTFRLRLTMLSDWHVGSGTGRPGNIDRLIVRDEDGLPFIPAKTLRGIWRDACERLARGLDEGGTEDWSHLVDHLFGSQPALGRDDPTGRHSDPVNTPVKSALMVRSARLPVALRRRVTDKQQREKQLFIEAMTFVKPGVQIDRRSGRAQTKFLRFEEMARVGTVLEAECELTLPPELREAASALLVGGAKLVERLGGKRRRGAGRCTFEVVDADATQAVTWLESHEKPPRKTPTTTSVPTLEEAAPRSDAWVVVPLVLNLTGPLAVSYRTVGNVVETLDFLPGSYLLPHVTRILKSLGVDPCAAIQRGDLCVLPATLEVGGQRGLPTPMALFEHKEKRNKIVNRLSDPEPVEQIKQLREGYVAPGLAPIKVPLVVRTHNTVEDGRQRPTSDVGGVYTYEAIASTEKGRPVRLRSELRLRKSLAVRLAQQQQDWWSRLAGAVSLGRSKKDDYGEVKLEVGQAVDFVSKAAGKPVVVWLLSDTLLRGDDLRPTPTVTALGEELQQRLALPPGSVTVRESSNGRLAELVRVRRLDTWHVGWGLPRPSLVALQAGSCVAFTIQGDIDEKGLREIEVGGVGERTAEGYGQLCFDDDLLTTSPAELTLSKKEDVNAPPNSGDLLVIDPGHTGYARLLEREVWKQEIRRAALSTAADRQKREQLLGWRINRDQSRPPMSQLGGLRGQVAQLRGAADVQALIAWLNHLADNRRRSEKWPDGAIKRIHQLVHDRSAIWTELRPSDLSGSPAPEWPTLTDSAVERLRGELWALAVRTLIDACIRAHKRELESREGNHGA